MDIASVLRDEIEISLVMLVSEDVVRIVGNVLVAVCSGATIASEEKPPSIRNSSLADNTPMVGARVVGPGSFLVGEAKAHLMSGDWALIAANQRPPLSANLAVILVQEAQDFLFSRCPDDVGVTRILIADGSDEIDGLRSLDTNGILGAVLELTLENRHLAAIERILVAIEDPYLPHSCNPLSSTRLCSCPLLLLTPIVGNTINSCSKLP
mmetsp:Transcript_23253/g.48315  ORF Transcript_23253/g.48315 Transcript_23253/m.48315 type:complete len:210 (-) Transcript_23253:546-1175(-)